MPYSTLLPHVIHIALKAGQMIDDIYQKGACDVFTKSDHTPVTNADYQSHTFIKNALSSLLENTPVISEESESIPVEQRQQWPRYWLIDPLDGTLEFIQRSGDFAVVIALIEHNEPILGVVYAPYSRTLYYASRQQGAWRSVAGGEPLRLPLQSLIHRDQQHLTLAVSSRQNLANIPKYLPDGWTFEVIIKGSASLKACLIAEGAADCYPRFGPTGEWDTAAAQCILREVGGDIINTQFQPLQYNLRNTLANPYFLATGKRYIPWGQFKLPHLPL